MGVCSVVTLVGAQRAGHSWDRRRLVRVCLCLFEMACLSRPLHQRT